MKRLLAYLFMVLGLGLVFSVNANAKVYFCKPQGQVKWLSDYRTSLEPCSGLLTKSIDLGSQEKFIKSLISDAKILKDQEFKLIAIFSAFKAYERHGVDPKLYISLMLTQYNENYFFPGYRDFTLVDAENYLKNTQIAKKEPSQTQEVASIKNNFYLCVVDYGNSNILLYVIRTRKNHSSNCKEKIYQHEDEDIYQKLIKVSKLTNAWSQPGPKRTINRDLYKRILKTQIAKQEPSQTQDADQLHSHLIKPDTWVYFVRLTKKDFVSLSKLDAGNFLNNTKNMNNYKFDTTDNLFKYQRNIGGLLKTDIRISKKLHDTLFNKDVSVLAGSDGMGGHTHGLSKGKKDYLKLIFNRIEDYKPKILKDLIDEYTEDNELKEGLLAYFDQEKPTVKPKKKVKVAKTTQEEFKPEDKDIDNDPPVIEIAEAITVNDSNYEIEGKVSDKGSDKIYVKVDGRNVVVKKGKFKIKRYSPVDEQIEIVAIDQWGNKSKPKLVNITIDIQETVVVEKLEPLNPSKIRSKSSNNKVALIIGIENYSESPKATYANLDAKYFFDYARKAFGVKKQNINLLIDDKATLGSINKVLYKWLVGKVKANQTDLIIFFAGHGLASNDGKELYFLPQDGDPDLLSIMALSRTKLFEQIIKLNPKSVTMFLDTCYSGISRDEQMLLASARPIRIVADEQEGIPDNFTIFSATELDQISSGLKEANHGIFSYYLMKGLEGKADENKDYKITNGELLAYMDLNVSQKASELGRQQNPSLNGDPDQVLMSYR